MDRIDWDEFAERYDRQFLEDPLYNDMLRVIAEQAVAAGGTRILDLGSGTGGVTYQILMRMPDARITGAEPAAKMREQYAQRFADFPGVDVVDGHGLSLPFEDGEFDLVVSNLALHHIPHEEKPACAREIARVLRSGGRFIYCDHFVDFEGPVGDPARSRDMIEKTISWAMYSLDHGAYDHMLGLLKVIPLCLTEEGEYLETSDRWQQFLSTAGFAASDVINIKPATIGMKVLTATAS
jgi:ubiquinone/menaquinone biosynthesis C-methylase UbiE